MTEAFEKNSEVIANMAFPGTLLGMVYYCLGGPWLAISK